MRSYTTRPVYDTALWLAVKDDQTGNIVATGIAELDREIGEGILEWIQVSQDYRRKGLGRYIVSEFLWRMKGKAGFATVSGQCNNRQYPEWDFISFTEPENEPSMALLQKLGYKDMGYIPAMESRAFGKWTTPATEEEIVQAAL